MTGKTTLELVIPRGLEAVTGGFIYDRRIVEQLRRLGWRVTVHELDPGFPLPSDRALSEAAETLGRIPDRRLVVIDGLALGGMPDIVKRECARLRLVALIHHPLAFETGLSADAARTLRNAERRALAAVARIIVTSRTTGRALSDYAVSPESDLHRHSFL